MNQKFALQPFAAVAPALAERWRVQAAGAPVFLSWDWQRLMHCDEPIAAQTQVLMQGGEPVAMLSHRIIRRRGGLRVRQWHLNETGDPRVDQVAVEYNGFLKEEASEAAFAWLLRNLPDADALVVRNASGPAASALVRAAAAIGWRSRTAKETSTLSVDLVALRASGRDYEVTLGRNTRAAIRRSRRLYREKFGPLSFRQAESTEEAQVYFERLERLHTAQWRAREGEGAFANARFRQFHQAYLEHVFPAGAAALSRVTAGGREVGYLYSLLSPGRWVMAYQSGFAAVPDNQWKPGYMCHALAVEHFAAHGAARYDFLAGPARYKRQLASQAILMRSVVAFAPRPSLVIENGLRRVKEQTHIIKHKYMRAIRQCPTK